MTPTGQPLLQHPILHRRTQVGNLSIFYREAGPADAPVLLLLHGFPSSSRMYKPLLDRLSDRFRLIAPDYPGFGHSDWPDAKDFDYTFDQLASVMDGFVDAMGLSHYTLYMQDYGGPVGFRMAIARPDLDGRSDRAKRRRPRRGPGRTLGDPPRLLGGPHHL